LVANRGGYANLFSDGIVNNDIIINYPNGWGNSVTLDAYSTLQISYSNIEGGYEGEGNIDLSPLFSDAENDDYSLQSESPCIDTGIADIDGDGIDDIIDFYGLAPDMGVYEYEPEYDFILGDVNFDNEINVLDIVLMVSFILGEPTDEYEYSAADINQDGLINILDVVQLVNIILGVTQNTINDIDGNVYETIQIGDQLWMAENLKVTHYQNSDEIPYIYNDPQYGAYINYSNNADNVGVYGRLYNWFAVNDERGLCPDNWHVPSDDEFKSLEMYLGMSESEANGEGLRGTDEGGKLKEEGNEHWNSPNTGATNETDFIALPGGNRRYETYTNQEIFSGLNRYGFFWSSSEVYTVNAWYRVFSFDYSESNRYHLSKTNAFSIRCVED
jgi:uncharacterized protein (TIGR02145 family)